MCIDFLRVLPTTKLIQNKMRFIAQQLKIILSLFLAFCFDCVTQDAFAQQIKPTIKDLTIPVSKAEDALCFQLHTVTLTTANLDSARRFFVQGMGMQLSGPIKLNTLQKRTLIKQWELPAGLDWQLYELSRPSVPDNIRIRLLVVARPTALIHESYQVRELGSFGLGFPNAKQVLLDQELQSLGFSAKAPLQTTILPKPDGGQYRDWEATYMGPDFVHYTGIERGNGMPQLAAYDTVTGKGGPGYTSMVVTGMSDAMISFFRYVLGWEVRRDVELTTGKGSPLGLEEGIKYRYTIAYAKGASSGHIQMMDFRDGVKITPKTKPRLPNRGIGMYTVFTKNLDEVRSLAIQQNAQILSDITSYEDPIHGRVRSLLLVAPNETVFEVLEKPRPLF